MESHAALAHHAIHSMEGLTAFSALPDAPVLPVRERRARRFGGLTRSARWRVRGTPRQARFRPVTASGRF